MKFTASVTRLHLDAELETGEVIEQAIFLLENHWRVNTTLTDAQARIAATVLAQSINQGEPMSAEELADALNERFEAYSLDSATVQHIYRDVLNGRGGHGDMLKSFAGAVVRADSISYATLEAAALEFIDRFNIAHYAEEEWR